MDLRRNELKLILVLSSSLVAPIAAHAQAVDDPNEIVVTASRREETAIQAPYNISAYSAASLEKARVNDVSSLSRIAPGIAVLDTGATNISNRNPVTFRGLNVNGAEIPVRADGAVPTVAQFVGEVPIQFPVHFFDISRVEVLRGPQGTLYGSGSLAGALKFIPRAPEQGVVSGYASGALGSVNHGHALDFSSEGAINLPIGDVLALRAAGGYVRNAGFIDAIGRVQIDSNGDPVPRVAGDPNSGFIVSPRIRDTNRSEISYGRVALSFHPDGPFDLTLSYERQHAEADDPQDVNSYFPGASVDISAINYPGALYANAAGVLGGAFPNGATTFPAGGEYDQLHMIASPSSRDAHIANATAEYDFGFGKVTSATSYVKFESEAVSDRTGTFAVVRRPGGVNLASYYGFYPRLIAIEANNTKDEFFTQEIRLVSSSESRLNYVIGGFYQNQTGVRRVTETMPGLTAWFGLPASFGETTYTEDRSFKFKDFALFGEISYAVSDRLRATVGARQFWQTFNVDARQTFPICGSYCANDGLDPSGLVFASSDSKVSDHIFKLNLSFKVSDNLLAYGTFSQGFRRGGANGAPLAGLYASLPQYQSYRPDTVDNFEIGLKGRIGRSTFSITAFQDNWDNFQFEAVTPSFGAGVVVNGRAARTRGFELELASRKDVGLSYTLGYSFTDAKITEDFSTTDLPLGGGPPVTLINLKRGERLPGVPQHTATASLGYGWKLSDSTTISTQVDASYRGEATSDFPGSVVRYARIAPFALVNASISLEKSDWSASLFIANIADERGETAGNFTTYDQGLLGSHRNVTRPRTFGIRLRYNFGSR